MYIYIYSILFLPSSFVSLSYFNLTVLMSKCSPFETVLKYIYITRTFEPGSVIIITGDLLLLFNPCGFGD